MTNKEREEFLIQQFTDRIENSQKHVFSPAEIVSLLTQLRAEYPFPRSLSERKLQRTLVDDGILREISLTATYSFEAKRYHFGAFSEYELAYFCGSGTRSCNRSRTGNLRRFVPSCSQYREQEQLCGAKLGEGIVTAELVTVNKKGA